MAEMELLLEDRSDVQCLEGDAMVRQLFHIDALINMSRDIGVLLAAQVLWWQVCVCKDFNQ